MHSAMELRADHDLTDVPAIVRGAVKLGLLESVIVLLVSLASRLLMNGPVQTVLIGLIVLVGLATVIMLPGLWTRPRTIEGIAGAAGIGLGAAIVFLLVDVTLLQNIGTYGHRWWDLGGGANWWYHPVWWMVGSFLPWMGAWILANQLAKSATVSPVGAFALVVACSVVLAVVAVLARFPGASWGVGTFGVAFLPGVVLAAVISGLGAKRA
jgi:riboflavin transporter FmnP